MTTCKVPAHLKGDLSTAECNMKHLAKAALGLRGGTFTVLKTTGSQVLRFTLGVGGLGFSPGMDIRGVEGAGETGKGEGRGEEVRGWGGVGRSGGSLVCQHLLGLGFFFGFVDDW